ncbi:MAG: FG-GAP-like repeat-containing protein, partial [Candidatus Moranbacteria bacterium]|nr:FG-GAP-like repeat-containing protein [Candidatus Moranbacteria bacterium]
DFNVDGKTDLSVGANIYSSNAGRAYIFYNDGSIPTSAASADIIITGEASSYFGYSMAVGDFNADGKTDLAIGAYGYATNVGRVYIYETRDDFAWQLPSYSTGMRVNNLAGDELKITGESSGGYFGGGTPTAGDFNSDGRVDLAVGAYYANGSGKIYIFYNDGSISNSAALADVIITGEASSRFGVSIAAGDFNSDGRMDLAVGGDYYITQTGRTYIFYNDGSYPTEAASADAIITGTATTDRFGQVLAAGDFNSDGRTDLAVGAPLYGSNNGRAYIFYNDGSYPAAAIDADIQIAAEGINDYFAIKIAVGDLDSDGIDDLIIGAYYYNSYTGRAYIFYNDGSIPTLAADANAIITGEGTLNNFGTNLACSDFNSDGRTDLIVSAPQYATYTGRAYIFYNDGSIPTSAADADVIITGESIYNNFSSSFAIGDFNSDGRADLAVGAIRYNTYTGRAYIFYNDGSIPALAADADVILEGETTDSNFGSLGV